MISIIITHYKTLPLLKLCIGSIEKHCRDIDYEIIVTDSESSCYNKQFIQDNFPQAKFIGFKENVGYATLVNAGIKKSQGNFILILNSDIVVTSGSILRLMNFLAGHDGVGVVGPQLLNFGKKIQNSRFRFYTPLIIILRRTFLGKLKWGKKKIDKFLMKNEIENLNISYNDNVFKSGVDNNCYLEVDWLMGSAIMTKREAIDVVGLLDEKFFMYFEDVDWAKRFKKSRYKIVYLPSATMYHYHQKASGQKSGICGIFKSKYTRTHIKSAIRYFWKHGIH